MKPKIFPYLFEDSGLCSKLINKQPNLFKGAYLLGCALFVLYVGITKSYYSWDMIGYVASAYELSGISGNTLRDTTYGDVRSVVPPYVFQRLVGTDPNIPQRLTVYEDASAFQQQIPFFKIRYVYVWMTYALGQLIGSFSQATVLISATAASLIVLISGILFWNTQSVIAFLFVPPIVVSSGVLTISRHPTPDALVALVAIFLCALILARKYMLAALLIALLPLFRTDYLIFALTASFILFLRDNSRLAVLSAFSALLIYFATNTLAGNYGHLVIFNYTLIDRWNSVYILSMPISDNLLDYVEAYIRGTWSLVNQPNVFLYPVIYTTAIIFCTSMQNRYQNRFLVIYFACLFFIAVHFLLFPAALARHYFMLPWASIMYLAEAFIIFRHQCKKEQLEC